MNQVTKKKKVKLCRILNKELYAKVKTGKHLSSEFKIIRGLRQGNTIALLLFKVLLDMSIRRSKVETQRTIFDTCSPIMAYADNVVTTGRLLKDVKEVFYNTGPTNK